MTYKELQPYTNGGFEQNEPDYVFYNIEFVGTCGSYPEQYDCVYNHKGTRYQVGYVRLWGGRLRCYFPDVGGELIYAEDFDERHMGDFYDEDSRVHYLELIAEELVDELIPYVIMLDKKSRLKGEI